MTREPVESELSVWPTAASLTLLALLLRLPGLGAGLWYDEYVTLVEAVRAPLGQILTTFPWNNDHKLYSVLAHLSVSAFGESAWSLRLPAMIFGVLSVPLLFLLAREVLGPRGPAASAALLLAVFWHHVSYSQNARGYSGLLFWVLAATWLLLRVARERRVALAVSYGVVCALGAYTHLTMIPIVIGHAAVGLVWVWARAGERAERFRLGAIGMGAAAILTAVAYAPLVSDISAFFLHPTQAEAGSTDVATPVWMIVETLRSLTGGGAALLVALPVLALAAWVGCLGLGSIARRPSGWFALGLFVAPALTVAAFAMVLGRPVYPRFFLFLTGFALIGLVAGIRRLTDGRMGKKLARGIGTSPRRMAMVVMVLLALGVGAQLRTIYALPKQDFESAVAYLDTRATEGTILTVGLAAFPIARYFGRDWAEIIRIEDFDSTVEQGDTWVVYSFPSYVEAVYPGFVARLSRDCQIEREFPGSVRGGALVVVACLADARDAA
jgi:hypothetical protein